MIIWHFYLFWLSSLPALLKNVYCLVYKQLLLDKVFVISRKIMVVHKNEHRIKICLFMSGLFQIGNWLFSLFTWKVSLFIILPQLKTHPTNICIDYFSQVCCFSSVLILLNPNYSCPGFVYWLFIITFPCNAHSDWLKQCALSENRA